jgi:hypothetical protein
MNQERYQTFEEFWPYYLGEHKDPLNRALHYVGTSLALGTIATAALTRNPKWLLLTPVVGYGPAWVGHFIIEKNRPATFKYPLWSLRGDFRMLRLALEGKIGAELDRLYPPVDPERIERIEEGNQAAAPGEGRRAEEVVHTNGAPAI